MLVCPGCSIGDSKTEYVVKCPNNCPGIDTPPSDCCCGGSCNSQKNKKRPLKTCVLCCGCTKKG